MGLCRFEAERWGWMESGRLTPVDSRDVSSLLAGERAGSLLDLAGSSELGPAPERLLPPVLEEQEVWAAGVTYESSKYARMSESESGGDFYANVYVADRPELFFKATPRRVVGPDSEVRIRADSRWNVPEPELAVVADARGRILGFTIGNDMSSRDIEGANPLYLPQAKVYRGSCALGPWIVPAESIDPHRLAVNLSIKRAGVAVFEGETSTARMKRRVEELVEWLFRENDFPRGVILLTGTGIIPPDDFTLQPGDEIAISIEGIGALRNVVAQR